MFIVNKENLFSFFLTEKKLLNEPRDFTEEDQKILKTKGYDCFRLPKQRVLKMVSNPQNLCISTGQELWLKWIYEDVLYDNSTPCDIAFNPNQFILPDSKGHSHQDQLAIMKRRFIEEFGPNNNFTPTLLTMPDYLALLVGYYQKENKLLIPYNHSIRTVTKRPDGRYVTITTPYRQLRIDIESAIDSEEITIAPCIIPIEKFTITQTPSQTADYRSYQ